MPAALAVSSKNLTSASASERRTSFCRVARKLAMARTRTAASSTDTVNTTDAPSSTTPKDDVSGPMLSPSAANNQLVRGLAVTAAVSAAASGSAFLPGDAAKFVHLMAYAMLFGTTVYSTFVVGLTLFKNMPRQAFGRLQSKLFPKYFALTTGCNVVVLATLLLSSPNPAQRSVVALSVGLATSILNYVTLEPTCTKLMFERYDIENKADKTEADKQKIAELYKEFGKWHGASSVVNLAGLCAITAYGWWLASTITL